MKNIKYIISGLIMLAFVACQEDFIDLSPPASITDDVFYTEAEHFLSGSNRFYTNLMNWGDQGVYADHGSDLIGFTEASTMQEYGRGETQAPESDGDYSSAYTAIRDINLLLARAADYGGNDIGEYVAASYFHRAYQYWALVQKYGGVTLVLQPLDVDSEELNAPRNSRYEVVAQILADLDAAMAGLPNETNIASGDKGKISKEAAMAFKAEVLLHEATWMKYVGTSTDGDGTSTGAGSAGFSESNINAYLQEAASLCKSIMNGGYFELWDHNDVLDNLSSNFLFVLEDGGSNPAGLDKSSNKEYIFYAKYDFIFRQANTLLSHVYQGRVKPSRKMVDMFLSSDGLPIGKSPLFEGYAETQSEFQNRDYRLRSYFTPHLTVGEIPQTGDITMKGTNAFGYANAKFMSWKWGGDGAYRATRTESFDMPFIRLPEVYLTYAEALYELNGTLTDPQMDESINLVKARAGLPPLSNAFLSENGMDLGTEIRRERTIELFAESATRYTDLRRWGIAEEELGKARYGAVIESTAYENNIDLYDPSTYAYPEESTETGVGLRRCIVVEPSDIRNFARHHYLFPLPTSQTSLNESLLQNPGY